MFNRVVGRTARQLAHRIVMLASCTALTAITADAQADRPAPGSGAAVLDEIGAFYDAHPEMKTAPGSGWKPYNRLKWYREKRIIDGRLPDPHARWNAWERKRELESARGATEAWFSLGPANFGGRMLAIDVDPTNGNIAYAGAASGGLFKTTNGGTSWLAVTDDLPSLGVGGVAVSRTDPNIVVIGTGEPTFNIDQVAGVGIYRSTDGGATWAPTNIAFQLGDGHGFHVMTAAPSGVFLGGAVDGIYRSDDDGATWTLVMGTVSSSFVNGWYDIQYDPEVSTRVYAVKGNDSADNGVYVSEDDGLTWNLVGVGQPASSAFGKSKLGVSGSTVYCYIGVAGFSGGVTGLIRSTDDGATWTTQAANNIPTNQSWYNLSCVADPDDADRVFCAAVRLARSDNGGDFFGEVDPGVHVDHHALLYTPGSTNTVWALSDGGVFRSALDGTSGSWIPRNNGVVSYQFYDICVNNGPDPYYVMGGTQDNGTDKWSGTTTWADGLGADGMVCNIDPTDGTTVYAEIQFGDHRKSTTSGTNFFEINNGITGNGVWVTPVEQDQTNGDRLFTETSAGIFRTMNGGSSWEQVSTHRADWISISPVNTNVVWTARGISARKTIDGGDNWASVTSFPFTIGSVTQILAHPTDVSGAFVTFSSFDDFRVKVIRTTDGGTTWQDVSGDLPDIPVNSIVVDPNEPTAWYVGTDLGVWYTFNGGTNWMPYGTGLPNVVVEDVEIKRSLNKLVAGTHGRGAWEIALAAVVAVDDAAPTHPLSLMFDAPFPNPSGDRVIFRYAAHSDAPVTLRIFDVRGRLVDSLEELPRGDGIIRTTAWMTGAVPAGLYFAKLEAGADLMTRKVLVQK